MAKRIVSAGLWLLALGWAANYVSATIGSPLILGFAFSVAVSAFIGMDPFHLFWPALATKTTATTPQPVTRSGVARPQV